MPRRILIVGTTGAGKSTLARRAGEKLGLPVTDGDDLYWLPGWTPRPTEDFVALAAAAARAEDWIIVGNYSALRDVLWPRADTVVWLDYSFWRIARQLLSRTFRRVTDGVTVCNGNVETLAKTLSKDGILWWFVKTYRRRRREFSAIFAAPPWPGLSCVRLRSPAETEAWLRGLG